MCDAMTPASRSRSRAQVGRLEPLLPRHPAGLDPGGELAWAARCRTRPVGSPAVRDVKAGVGGLHSHASEVIHTPKRVRSELYPTEWGLHFSAVAPASAGPGAGAERRNRVSLMFGPRVPAGARRERPRGSSHGAVRSRTTAPTWRPQLPRFVPLCSVPRFAGRGYRLAPEGIARAGLALTTAPERSRSE